MIVWLWYGVKVHLKQTEYYKPLSGTEHNNAEIVQMKDNSGSNVELSACALSYVSQSVSNPGQTSGVEHSAVNEHAPKPEWKTPGHT